MHMLSIGIGIAFVRASGQSLIITKTFLEARQLYTDMVGPSLVGVAGITAYLAMIFEVYRMADLVAMYLF